MIHHSRPQSTWTISHFFSSLHSTLSFIFYSIYKITRHKHNNKQSTFSMQIITVNQISAECFKQSEWLKKNVINADGVHLVKYQKQWVHESAQELQQHITKRDKNEPNRKIPILKYLKFVNGISTEMKVPVFWKTAQTQIGKHHILVSSCWESEYFRKWTIKTTNHMIMSMYWGTSWYKLWCDMGVTSHQCRCGKSRQIPFTQIRNQMIYKWKHDASPSIIDWFGLDVNVRIKYGFDCTISRTLLSLTGCRQIESAQNHQESA